MKLTVDGILRGNLIRINRSPSLVPAAWTNIHTFVGSASSANWVESAPAGPAFYKVTSE